MTSAPWSNWSSWKRFPARDLHPKRLPRNLPKQWKMQPSFKTAAEKIDWLFRRQQAIKRARVKLKRITQLPKRKARKPRLIADGPGPGGSWSKGWPSNPGLTGGALIRERMRKAKRRNEERNAARVGLEPLYDALEALSGAIEKLVSQRVIDNRRKKS